jgi:hypothetical protein
VANKDQAQRQKEKEKGEKERTMSTIYPSKLFKWTGNEGYAHIPDLIQNGHVWTHEETIMIRSNKTDTVKSFKLKKKIMDGRHVYAFRFESDDSSYKVTIIAPAGGY